MARPGEEASKASDSQSFSASVVLRVAPEVAFDFLADPATAHVIDPAVISYEPEGGTMGAGVRNHIRAKLFGIPLRMISETKAWERPHRMVMENVRPARPVRAVATHLFESHAEGTRYTWAMEFVPNGIGGRLAAPLVRRSMERNALRQQARFKAALEQRTGGGTL